MASQEAPDSLHMEEDIRCLAEKLMPYFEVTEEERQRFEDFELLRVLQDEEYIGHSRFFPGYGYDRNIIYIPLEKYELHHRDTFMLASSYVHAQLNPHIVEAGRYVEQAGQQVPGYGAYVRKVRWVAYGLYTSDEEPEWEEARKFAEHCGGLPEFARMSIREAIQKKLIMV